MPEIETGARRPVTTSGGFSREELERIRSAALQRLKAIPQAAVAPQAEVQYGPRIRRAAVVSKFQIDTGDLPPDADVRELLSACVPLSAPSGQGWWTMKPDVRNSVLKRIGKTGIETALPSQLDDNDALPKVLGMAVTGSIQPQSMSTAQLAALLQVYNGISDILSLPDRDAVERELALKRLLEPFRVLTRTFAGREADLQKLRDYVGVLPPQSIASAAAAVVKAFLGIVHKAPFVVFGDGGVGKSTLIAQFVLEHALLEGGQQFPFAYIDFDRPSIDPQEPSSLLLEAVVQIGLQYPDAYAASRALRRQWEPLLRVRQSGSAPTNRQAFIDDFASFLDVLQLREESLLIVLDTFEEVQQRSSVHAAEIVRFLEELGDRVPRLRTVIAGRVNIPGVKTNDTLELKDFDEKAAIGYLTANKVPAAHAQKIAKQVGGSPLSLHLALALYEQEKGAIGSDGFDIDTGFLWRATDNKIQGQLFDRILLHIADDEVRNLAYPGLVLRRITPELIRDVLAKPCGVDVPDRTRAKELFDRLANQISLVLQPEPEVIVHRRPDVRRLMLQALRERAANQVEEIHHGAVVFYSNSSDVVSRAEEIYHRLSLRQAPNEIAPRLMDGLLPYLAPAMQELEPPEQAFLAECLGLELPPDASTAADQQTWERATSRKIAELMHSDQIREATKLLSARKERSGATDLRIREAELVASTRRLQDAREIATDGIRAYQESGNVQLLFRMLLTASSIELSLGDSVAARMYLGQAEDIAGRHDDPVMLARVLIGFSQVSAAAGMQALPDPDVGRRLIAAAARISDADFGRDRALLRMIAIRIGFEDQTILGRAINLGALELRRSDVDRLSRELRSVGIPVSGESAFRTQLAELLMRRSAPFGVTVTLMQLLLNEPPPSDKREAAATASDRVELKLSPEQRSQMARVMEDVFVTRHNLAFFLETRLDRSLSSLSFSQSLGNTILDVIRAAEREEWLVALLVALTRSNFSNAGLQEVADSIDIGIDVVTSRARGSLTESAIRKFVTQHRGTLGELDARTCTIEQNGTIRGSGLLIGPDLVLTAASAARNPTVLSARFDCVVMKRKQIIAAGQARPLSSVVYAGEKYTILRLDEPIAQRPIDVARADADAAPRGFARIIQPRRRIRTDESLYFFWRGAHGSHLSGFRSAQPLGEDMVAIETSAMRLGAACLDQEMDIAGFYVDRDGRTAIVMSIAAIVGDLNRAGFEHLLFGGSSA